MASVRRAAAATALLLLAPYPAPGGAAAFDPAAAFAARDPRRCGGALGRAPQLAQCNLARRGHRPSPPTAPASITARASATARDGGGRRAPPRGYDVLYQKVLRAPARTAPSGPNTLLLDAVAYLQCVYRLPGELPMPYELAIPDERDNGNDDAENEGDGNDGAGDERAVLIIDSPLGNGGEARLEVEVLGIFPDNADVAAGATMALVALKKRRDASGGGGTAGGAGGVAGELFAASERRIAQSLDRGLQALEEGRVAVPLGAPTDADGPNGRDRVGEEGDGEADAAMRRMGYRNAVDAANSLSAGGAKSNGQREKAGDPISIERDGMGNVVIDRPSLPVKEPTGAKRNGKAAASTEPASPKSTNEPSAAKKHTQKAEGDDYAVRMARRRAEALMSTAKVGRATSTAEGTVAIRGGEGNFAVRAAKRAAEARSKGGNNAEKVASKGAESGPKGGAGATRASTKQPAKRKVQDLSNDETFLKLQSIANEAKRTSWKRTVSKAKNGKEISRGPAKDQSKNSQLDRRKATKDQDLPTINGASQQKKEMPAVAKSDDEIQSDVLRIARQNERVQRELKAATDLMPVEKEGEGLSPEELLADILKFGEEKEKEETPGRGFVEGARGKARGLLRDEGQLGSNGAAEAGFRGGGSSEERKRRREEEELRRIFAAGQSVAENRLSRPAADSPASHLAKLSITEEDIDALIDADDAVPLNARVLDDELAELEVRLSRSPDESFDGPPQNELFDVFSGPEVYDPNVDAATAVNWPGARTDTRTDVRLARDLSTAVKQARFAAAVLAELREEGKEGEGVRYFVGAKELSSERVTLLRKCVQEAVRAGIVEDPEILLAERARLQMLIDELTSQPEERLEEIAMNYKDLLLSDNLVELIKERLHAMARRDVDARREGNEERHKDKHARERAIMMNLAQIAQVLVKEAQALGAELEVSMLEIIRSICEVAMDPSHASEEETAAALSDAVRDMRPLLDDAFVAYLKYAIAEEEGKLARAGVVDDPEHNRWLFVLKIVQEGVYAELSQGVRRYVDHIWYVLRMKSKAERKGLLKKLIDSMPTMDIRPFVKVVNNIVSSLGTTVNGDFSDGVLLGDMTNQLLQLQRDVNDLLPPERINELSEDADAWAATQRQRLLERRHLTRQRLEAARQTGDIDPDEVIKPGVEAERFD